MSRSGYSDSLDNWDLIRWRGAVKSALRGKRGQAFLRELRDSLEALPEKRLVASTMEDKGGCVCALGSVAKARGMDMDHLNDLCDDGDGDGDGDTRAISEEFGIARAMAAEIMFENDEDFGVRYRPSEDEKAQEERERRREEQRYQRMLKWCNENIVEEAKA